MIQPTPPAVMYSVCFSEQRWGKISLLCVCVCVCVCVCAYVCVCVCVCACISSVVHASVSPLLKVFTLKHLVLQIRVQSKQIPVQFYWRKREHITSHTNKGSSIKNKYICCQIEHFKKKTTTEKNGKTYCNFVPGCYLLSLWTFYLTLHSFFTDLWGLPGPREKTGQINPVQSLLTAHLICILAFILAINVRNALSWLVRKSLWLEFIYNSIYIVFAITHVLSLYFPNSSNTVYVVHIFIQ